MFSQKVGFLICCFLVQNIHCKTGKSKVNVTTNDIVIKGGNECLKQKCELGYECDLDDDNRPVCVCARKCLKETDERLWVCSRSNVTFNSQCELYRQKCLCSKQHSECLNSTYTTLQLDYYGPCKEIEECQTYELKQYPERMRDWLYIVMEELAKRKHLNKSELKMLKKASGENRKWILPVIWKFCDLDTSHDRLISVMELLPLSAPLKPLERCTEMFLDQCDVDSDGEITLNEWGDCLGLDKDDIVDRCEAIKNDNETD